MKAGREHRVPLTEPAVAVLRAVLPLRNQKHGDWIFPSTRLRKPLSNMAMTALLRRMKREDITVHGFRSTFRDWAAENTAHSREVAEAALAHVLADKVEAAYRRGDLFEKRRRLMEDWAKILRDGRDRSRVRPRPAGPGNPAGAARCWNHLPRLTHDDGALPCPRLPHP